MARVLRAKGWCEMTVMVWFARSWAGHEAHSLAEVTESLAEALVDAGVAVVVDLAGGVELDEADGSDEADGPEGPEGSEEPEAPKAVKGRGRRKR